MRRPETRAVGKISKSKFCKVPVRLCDLATICLLNYGKVTLQSVIKYYP